MRGSKAPLVIGVALHILVLPVFLASGLVVPVLAVGALAVVWALVLLVMLAQRDRPAVVLAGPVVALAILVAVVSLGEWLFDWTA